MPDRKPPKTAFLVARLILLGIEGADRFADRLFVCQHFVVPRFYALSLGAGGGLRSLTVTLPGDILFVFCKSRSYLLTVQNTNNMTCC